MGWSNWSGLAGATPSRVFAPRTTDDVVAAVQEARRAGTTVKMVGAGHSFTAIAAPEDTLLLPTHLTGVRGVDREAMTVTAAAGTRLHVLNHELERRGLSLHNMGDIAEQTLAGAISTGTHGSGGRVASLSAQVVGLELVTGTGEVLRATADDDPGLLDVARVGLGALGLLTSVTFRVEPLFALRAHERPVTWREGLASLPDLDDAHDHVDAYWFPHTDRMLVKTNDRLPLAQVDDRPLPRWRGWLDDELLSNTVFGGLNRVVTRVPAAIPRLNELSGRLLSERTYTAPAHRVFTSPRRVVFKEMEYAVPREAGMAALTEARRVIDASDWRVSFPVEVRFAPAEDTPLATSHGHDRVHLAFHTYVDAEHESYFSGIERVMRDHDGRPHWGKLHTLTAADLAPAYPRFGEFLAVRDRIDPDRVFANDYLRRVLGD